MGVPRTLLATISTQLTGIEEGLPWLVRGQEAQSGDGIGQEKRGDWGTGHGPERGPPVVPSHGRKALCVVLRMGPTQALRGWGLSSLMLALGRGWCFGGAAQGVLWGQRHTGGFILPGSAYEQFHHNRPPRSVVESAEC